MHVPQVSHTKNLTASTYYLSYFLIKYQSRCGRHPTGLRTVQCKRELSPDGARDFSAFKVSRVLAVLTLVAVGLSEHLSRGG